MGDKDIKRINSKFLSHNYPTDVITFKLNNDICLNSGSMPSLLDSDKAKLTNGEVKAAPYKNIEAEIYIGIEEIRRNSVFYKTTFYQEIKRVIIHGTLHLVGFQDNSKAKRKEMSLWEDHFLGNR